MEGDGREPWLPPGHAERLTVGARVRVVPSPECRLCSTAPQPVVEGVIDDLDPFNWRMQIIRAHRYYVLRDGLAPWYYAASELLPL